MKGKVVAITGAARGIGLATAEALIAQGAKVSIGDIDLELAEQEAQRIGAKAFKVDVRDRESFAKFIQGTIQHYGDLYALVNNAGITKDNLLLRMSEDDWDDILNIHLKAVFRLSKRVLKGMTKARFGRIINISSVVAHFANPGQANYSAAKAGIEAFSRSLAKEMGSRQITVNSIAPGFIATEMTEQLSEDIRKKMSDQVALSRFGEPQDIANAVSFLASDKASYITGTVLHVNGGLYMA